MMAACLGLINVTLCNDYGHTANNDSAYFD